MSVPGHSTACQCEGCEPRIEVNVFKLLRDKDAEIERLRTWLGDSEITVSKLRAAIKKAGVMLGQGFSRTDVLDYLQQALAEEGK